MFTGIIQSIGTVLRADRQGDDLDLVVRDAPSAAKLKLGDSVALDGVCQTVTHLDGDAFTVHAIAETLRVTTLGQAKPGSRLNLETALGAGEPLGGHFVQGHVDGIATLEGTEPWGESVRYRLSADASLVGQLVPKGSVALDGISLTVGPELGDTTFEVFLIPHSLQHTTWADKGRGDRVNLETDILGKYLLRYLRHGREDAPITWDRLREAGFGPKEGARA